MDITTWTTAEALAFHSLGANEKCDRQEAWGWSPAELSAACSHAYRIWQRFGPSAGRSASDLRTENQAWYEDSSARRQWEEQGENMARLCGR